MARPTLLAAVSSVEALHEAWRRVSSSKGAPGLDGVTTAQFAVDAGDRIDELARLAASGGYRPGALRRVAIPKPAGGYRVLGIPTVADRIVQTAAAIWLDTRFDPTFSKASFAYRPMLGARRASDALARLVAPQSWAVIADIEKFFDNVDHQILARELRTHGVDADDVGLINRWISAQKVGASGRFVAVKGLPQGAPLSPVLANLFLTPFDQAIEAAGFTHVRYADDFVVVADTEASARQALVLTRETLAERGLGLKSGKTDLAAVSDSIAFLGFEFDGATRRISAQKVREFESHATSSLAKAGMGSLVELQRELHDITTGWHNYFGGASTAVDQQLAALDRWLHREIETRARQLGVGEHTVSIMVGALAGRLTPLSAAPDYAEPEPATEVAADSDHGPVAESRNWVFGKRYQLASQAIASDQAPLLSSSGDLFIPTHGCYVGKSGEILVIKRKKAVVMEVPFNEIRSLTIEAAGATVSSEAILTLADRRVPVALCRASGLPSARLVSARAWHTATTVEQQVEARSNGRAFSLAVEMIAAKILNQRALLLYAGKYKGRPTELRRETVRAAQHLAELAGRCREVSADAGHRTAIFLTEARAAAFYWHQIAALLPSGTGNQFTRRRSRHPEDVVNATLNYGYWILRNTVWSALERTTLTPFIGVLHSGRRHSAGLVYDLMEEFRQPVVDRAVIALVGRRTKLEMDRNGRLRLRTRRLVREAIERALKRTSIGQPRSLLDVIDRQALAVQATILRGRPYEGYRMSW